MKRHSLNVFSLVFGIALILIAAWTAFAPRGWLFRTPEWRWQWAPPAAAILLGAAMMSPLLTNMRNKKASGDAGEGDPSPEEGI